MSFNWIEKHSTNCKNCGHLVDERECVPEDDGDICQDCYQNGGANVRKTASSYSVKQSNRFGR